MLSDIVLILIALGAMLCIMLSVAGVVWFLQSRINPSWTVKAIDLRRGVVLEVKNKRSHDSILKFFQVHLLIPGINGEAFVCLEDFPLKPDEAVEVCVKLYAGSMPEIGRRLNFSAKSSISPGGKQNLLYKTGQIPVLGSLNEDEKVATTNIEVSATRPSFSQFFITPESD